MELAKTTEAVEQPWNDGVSPVARWGQTIGDSSTVDQDIERAWELKAELRWVRNDHGPLNGFRWLLWDWYGLGHPPSGVEKRPTSEQPTAMTGDAAPSAPDLRLVTFEGGSSHEIGSPDEPARLGVIDPS